MENIFMEQDIRSIRGKSESLYGYIENILKAHGIVIECTQINKTEAIVRLITFIDKTRDYSYEIEPVSMITSWVTYTNVMECRNDGKKSLAFEAIVLSNNMAKVKIREVGILERRKCYEIEGVTYSKLNSVSIDKGKIIEKKVGYIIEYINSDGDIELMKSFSIKEKGESKKYYRKLVDRVVSNYKVRSYV